MVKPFSELQRRFSVLDLDEGVTDQSRWPRADETVLSEAQQNLFIQRANAVTAYLNNEVFSESAPISKREALRLLRKCIQMHPDNRIYGFRALLPYIRIKKYIRKASLKSDITQTHGKSGAFTALLRLYPNLDDLIKREVFKKGMRVSESVVSIKALHKKFINACSELGLEVTNAYPFDRVTRGYASLAAYVKKIKLENPVAAIKANGSINAVKKTSISDGTERPITEPYDRVECDAHHIDAIFCILIPSQFGEVIPKVIHRLWVIVIQEVTSRAILGYHLSIREECNATDLLETIKMALTKWNPRKLTIPELQYHEGAGYPSSHNQRLEGVMWREFSVDEALINVSSRVTSKLKLLSGGTSEPIVLKRHVPDDRPFIERFFQTLEKGSFHRLPNTTGTGIEDARRRNPDIAACKYFIQLEHLEEILDVVMANYNAEPHSSIGYRNPLQYLDYLTTNKELQYVNKNELEMLLSIRKRVAVKGGLAQGRRPYINFLRATYTSDSLRATYNLCGKYIYVEGNPKDLRTLRAYTENGAEIGVLKAAPPWHVRPHTIEMRRAITSLYDRKIIHYTRYSDPIAVFLNYVEDSLRSKKKKVPPAYLEARQLLTEEFQSDQLADYSYQAAPTKSHVINKPRKADTTEVIIPSLPPPRKTAI
ncbi:hypothetical protein [Methylophilus sp.]|uniref:hypothetical protein n=1 Tax=Methylophilus sp. TaxID=29541 RepID=UPI000D44E089|nr:hypothetical protein [Methylophilus sp.]PPD10724.1 MAG: hypothetical protein CTY26_12275 [Methylophilus sp.]